MAVFQVLTEVVSSVEFLRLIALSKLVDVVQVLSSDIPLRRVLKFLATISTDIGAIAR